MTENQQGAVATKLEELLTFFGYNVVVTSAEQGRTIKLNIETTDGARLIGHRGETLAAGQTKRYSVQSNGGRPIVAFAQPLDRSDLVLKFIEAGSTANEANYSGPGSAEAAFVLPLRTTDYTIEISAANDGAAAFTLIVVVLE